MRYRLAIVAILVSLPSGALAGADIMGVGLDSCAIFAKAYQSDPTSAETLYFQWAAGFMSAWDVGLQEGGKRPNDLSAISFEQQKEFLRQYCNSHPLAQYVEGVVELLRTLPYIEK
jgi:hypothetical protein